MNTIPNLRSSDGRQYTEWLSDTEHVLDILLDEDSTAGTITHLRDYEWSKHWLADRNPIESVDQAIGDLLDRYPFLSETARELRNRLGAISGTQRVERRIHGFPIWSLVLNHLAHNFYPAIDGLFLDAALDAIRLAENGQWDEDVTVTSMVDDHTWTVPVRDLISDLHLEQFLSFDMGQDADLWA